ncbi:MAG: hypothetical protein JW731_16255 [Bacteroidales bacterium]|nr:hypothetical protein [Bacteroidales bacterium]
MISKIGLAIEPEFSINSNATSREISNDSEVGDMKTRFNDSMVHSWSYDKKKPL